MFTIDGSDGEGGGQILRSSLGLSMVTGTGFEITNIRGKRKKPGLLRQHLTSVNAAAAISKGSVEGNHIGSDRLVFVPGKLSAGEYHFAIGTAGSTTLVMQAILPGLLMANGESTVIFEGGTHNPFAPPFDFLEKSFLRIIKEMGVDVDAEIERYGFFPAGGGKFKVKINPAGSLKKINLTERGNIKSMKGVSLFSKIPVNIAKSEIQVVRERLKLNEGDCSVREVVSPGPGNAVLVEAEYDNVTFIATSFGEKGVSRVEVANRAVKQTEKYLTRGAPVCSYLADQLLIPMAMAGGGIFRTSKPSLHMETNAGIIEKFMDITIDISRKEDQIWEVKIGGR